MLKLINLLVSAILTAGYDLIVIEDEATPLANTAGKSNYLIAAVIIFLIAIMIISILAYLLKRAKLVERLLELREKSGDKSGKTALSIGTLKDEIIALENLLINE